MTTPLTREPDAGQQDAQDTPVRLVVISGGVSDPSSTRLLADRTAQKTMDLLREAGIPAVVSVIELGPLAVDIARAIVSGFPGNDLQAAITRLADADAIIASTPVYKAGISGLFKSFADILDNDLLIAKPVILAATAGTSRHAMVVDEQFRPLFAFLRALPVPTSLFAAPEDWGSKSFGERIERAATELVLLLKSGVGRSIADSAWSGYQHQFAGHATRADRTSDDVDFDTDLMRLAAGGGSQGASPNAPVGAGARG
jgi:FMN reductase